jgi:hypothetical protein
MEEIIIIYRTDILEKTNKLQQEFKEIEKQTSDVDHLIRKGEIIAQLQVYCELLNQAI